MILEDWTQANQALDVFRSDVNSLMNEVLQETGDTATYQPTVYHYTDVKGALGILQAGRLWFTERVHLNDPVEIKYGLEIAHNLFEIEARKRGAGIPRDAALHLKGEHGFNFANYGFWMASFSLDGDQLGQWRNYADDGRGVCLAFSVENLDTGEIANPIPSTPSHLRFPVSYDKDLLCRRLQAPITLCLDLLENANLVARDSYYVPYGPAQLYERDCFNALNNALFLNSLLHKHPAYEYEKEYRFLINGLRNTISKWDYHRFRERKGEIVGYLDLAIPKWKQPATLTHIRLGPTASDKLKDQLGSVLMAQGIPMVPIEQSDVPYRSTR